MKNQLSLFADESVRSARVRRMHMIDAGPNPCVGPAYVARYRCAKCGTETQWQTATTATEIRRGVACTTCNVEPKVAPPLRRVVNGAGFDPG